MSAFLAVECQSHLGIIKNVSGIVSCLRIKEGSAVSYVSVDHKRIDAILILIWIMSVFGLTLSLIREWRNIHILRDGLGTTQIPPPLPVSVVGQITYSHTIDTKTFLRVS
jgi:hypothetical protein